MNLPKTRSQTARGLLQPGSLVHFGALWGHCAQHPKGYRATGSHHRLPRNICLMLQGQVVGVWHAQTLMQGALRFE